MSWSQNLRKGIKRAVDMSPADELSVADLWTRPPADECEEERYDSSLPGADPEKDRVKIRIVRQIHTYSPVVFSLTYQTYFRRKWHDVVEIDSCHDTDVHLHQYGRSTGARIGDAQELVAIKSLDDVQVGYNHAHEHLENVWAECRSRWHHG